jgi:hypothetical protein
MSSAESESYQVAKPREKRRNNMPNKDMKSEYDFSKGERGKFHRPDAKFNLPIYLNDDVLDFVQKIAKKKKKDVSEVVNEMLLIEKRLVEVIQ